MRDIALTLFVFGSLPFILRRPWMGLLMWTWLSLMSPSRLTWGFAYHLPFSKAVAVTTLLSILISKESKTIQWRPLTVVWGMFVVWMCITTVFALSPGQALIEFDRMIKIQLFCFLTLMLGGTKERLNSFVWVVALSLAFYGIKGGIFTITTGGNFLVWGPAGSFIEGNNELAFAVIVAIPFVRFLQMHAPNKWVSLGLGLSIPLCAVSALGSHSRGAFLALMSMGLFLFWKSRQRALLLPTLVILVPLGLSMMPQKFWDRMATIENYEQDKSAMGRINSWTFAWNLAKDRPLTGGGFRTFTPALFRIYAPDPNDFHDVHSIWFEVLGEQGWVGFILYMTVWILAYGYAGWTARRARGDPDLAWHHDLGRMTQVALVGYAVGGTFLGLAYFDLFYDILIIIMLNRLLVEQRLAERPESAPVTLSYGHAPQSGQQQIPRYGRVDPRQEMPTR